MDDTNRQFVRIAAVSLLVILLPFLVFGGRALWASHLRAQEQQAQNAERHQFTAYGMPLLSEPLEPGGPTTGPGAHADFETTDRGWQWQEGHPERFVMLTVKNKSAAAWSGVEAELRIFNRQGRYLRNEPCAFGSLAPGQSVQRTFGPVEAQDYSFEVEGYKGRRMHAP